MLSHKVKLLLLFVIICLLAPVALLAQEEIRNLNYNHILKQEHKTERAFNKTNAVDTIALPFLDDFSSTKIFPDQTLWLDSNVFINDDFSVNPLSIGAATFDGIDKFGNPYYNQSSTGAKIADYLTSKPINLEEHNDIPYTPADSLYLSFFYQPQGRAPEYPQSGDSLILEFRVPSDSVVWRHVWGVGGTTLKPFKQVMIPVTNSINFKKGFQFRFKNYTSRYGRLDHWNIDYVRLDKGRTKSDTAISEVTWVERTPSSLLKNYEAMPWTHFIGNESAELKTSFDIRVRNNDNTSFTTFYRLQVKDELGAITTLYPGPTSGNRNAITPLSNSYTTISIVGFPLTVFPGNSKDSASFSIEKIIEGTTSDKFPSNDILIQNQNFYNYYAYDDGTAESAYGLNAIGGRIAYFFNTGKADSLRAISIFFNQMLKDVSLSTFKLAVWSDLNAAPVYESAELSPVYENTINGFHTYRIDEPFLISGQFYIGWIQNTKEYLNIGLDMNTTTGTDKKYYYVPAIGKWIPSTKPGAWMMRPHFGKKLPLISGTSEASKNIENGFSVYPNPASDRIYIKAKEELLNKLSDVIVTLNDAMGRLILTQNNDIDFIDISAVPNGFYFIKITDRKLQYSSTHKIVINK